MLDRLFRLSKRVRAAAVLTVGALAALIITGSATTKTTYVIADGAYLTTVEGYAGDSAAALARAGIEIGAADLVTEERDGSVVEVSIQRPVVTVEENVLELLPFQSIRREDPDLPVGEEHLVQEGRAGTVTETVQVTTDPDGTVHRLTLGQETVQPVDEVTAYGTKLPAVPASWLSATTDVLTNLSEDGAGGGVLTTASGTQLRYSKAITCVATAYTTERQSWKKTATGTIARVGAIAVDPKVIPYGTRMYIVSSDGSITYGVATAEDCGSGVKGRRIDLFYDTYDACINFGVRDCTVYILD